jgi:hypothetical protein
MYKYVVSGLVSVNWDIEMKKREIKLKKSNELINFLKKSNFQ